VQVKHVPIDKIKVDRSMYPRSSIDYLHISHLRDALLAGNELPPILCDQHLRLIDGYHRLEAYKKAKATKVPVVIKHIKGEDEFLAEAVAANIAHGRPLSPYERVAAAIRLKYDYGWSDERIATLLKMPVDRLKRYLMKRIAFTPFQAVVPLKSAYKVYANKEIDPETEQAIQKSRGWLFWTPLKECIQQLSDTEIRNYVIKVAASDPYFYTLLRQSVDLLQNLLRDINKVRRTPKRVKVEQP